MGFLTPAGKDIALSLWCVLDSAGFKGMDEEGEPAAAASESGYRITGHGDKVEVSYEAADELYAESWATEVTQPDHRFHRHLLYRRQVETTMFSALIGLLSVSGYGFTVRPATDERAAYLLVHSDRDPGIYGSALPNGVLPE